MPTGIIVNACAVMFGGFLGAFFSKKIPERLKKAMPLTFGAASIGMGVYLIGELNMLPPVILSLLLGSAAGELLKLEKGIERCADKVRVPIEKLFAKYETEKGADFLEQFVSIVVLFCASATSIFGALNEGMTGDSSILLSKSFLDFFTALIFATNLGFIVTIVAVPQFLIQISLFFSAAIIMPFVNGQLLGDFSALGGIIMLVTGLRMAQIKSFPVANMLPGLIFIIPISSLWSHFFN